MLKLSAAVLCQDCDMVTTSNKGQCTYCGSTALLNLGAVLNRQSSNEGMLLAVRDAVEEFKQLNKSLAEIASFLQQERDASRELGEYIKSKGTKV